MTEISLFDAKTHLSGIVSAVEKDRIEFVITKRGKQVAKIVPIDYEQKPDIAAVLQAMDNLKQEIAKRGKTGVTVEEILEFKETGRKQ
jgi:prevent-host-death family protein